MAIRAESLNGPKAVMVLVGAITVAVFAATALTADVYLRLIGLMIVVLAGLIASFTQIDRPLLGLGALVASGIAFPIEFQGPAGVMVSSSFPLAAVLCTLWLFHLVVTRAPLDHSRVVYASIAFMATAAVSFAVGQFPWFEQGAPLPAQIAELGLIVLSVLLFLAVGHQFKTLRDLKYLTALVIVVGLFAGVVQSVTFLAEGVGTWTTRPGSIGSLFWTWLLALSLSQALLNRDLSPVTRIFLLGVTALVLYHGLVQVRSWASGWLPPLMALGVIVLFRFPRTAVAGALLGAPAVLTFFTYLSSGVLGDEEYSLLSREQAWATLWQLVERSPLVGTGLANYYYYTENFPLLGWYVRFIAHNNYQDMLVQTGFVGLAAFVWFSYEAFAMILRLLPQVPKGFAYAYLIGALGGLAGSLGAGMLGDWMIPFYYNAGILGFRSSLLLWVFLGGVLALKRMTRQSVEAASTGVDRETARARDFRRLPQPDWV
jgi:hypothetical protein